MRERAASWTRSVKQTLPLLLTMVAVACGPQATEPPKHERVARPGQQSYQVMTTVVANEVIEHPEREFVRHDGQGLEFRMSEAESQPAVQPKQGRVGGVALDSGARDALLARLGELPVVKGVSFAFREETLKPPLTGTDLQTPFPPVENLAPPVDPKVDKGPLQVLRYSPEGAVDITHQVSITFSAPMIPLSAIEDVEKLPKPAQISPAVEGSWQWLDPRTLVFKAGERLPMATDYTVTVPKGTRSANGNVLAEKFSFDFQTPEPVLTSWAPTGKGIELEPVIFLGFNQAIDQASALAKLEIEAAGQAYTLRAANSRELAEVEAYTSSFAEGHWLAIVADKPLPKDTFVSVNVLKGFPSAEGPKTVSNKTSIGFRTYGPFEIDSVNCIGWDCYAGPGTGFSVAFTNPIDESSIDLKEERVSPEMKDYYGAIYHNAMQLEGTTKPATDYTISFEGTAIRDIYGQPLEGLKVHKMRTRAPDLYATMSPSGWDFIVQDPYAPPTFNITTIGYRKLDVKLYSVAPADYPDYQSFVEDFHWGYESESSNLVPPGRLVHEQTIEVEGDGTQSTMHNIKLSPALGDSKYGQLILLAEPKDEVKPDPYGYGYNTAFSAWIQVTDLAVTGLGERDNVTAWVSSLKTGEPLADVAVEHAGKQAKTDARGLAKLARDEVGGLVVTRGEDMAFLPQENWRTWLSYDRQYLWYTFTDRGLYKPGESVHIKGWLRSMELTLGGDIGYAPDTAKSISYRVYDPQYNEIANGALEINDQGGFDMEFTLADNVNLGWANIEFMIDSDDEVGGLSHYQGYQVQEFRRPEFEVSVNPPEETVLVGSHTVLPVSAAYYSGGPLSEAQTYWYASASEGYFTPPNRGDFSFGERLPWWFYYRYINSSYQSMEGTTDKGGVHRLQMDFDSVDPRVPMQVYVEGSVVDVNRQQWTANTSFLVHPSTYYVGLRSDSTFIDGGEKITVDTIVSDIEGQLIPGRQVKLEASRLEWRRVEGEWKQIEIVQQRCELTSTESVAQCVFQTKEGEGGSWLIQAEVSDDSGRLNSSMITVYVSGSEPPPNGSMPTNSVTLVADHDDYQPGEVAEILVQAPWYPAHGLVTVARSGILATEEFELTEATYTLQIPIEEEHIPNLHVSVQLIGETVRENAEGEPDESLPPRPAYATGSLTLSVPAYTRTLQVEANPAREIVAPGEELSVSVQVKDPSGKALPNAEVALVVVDEAVLALSAYELYDIVEGFYIWRSSDFAQADSRQFLRLEDPELVAAYGLGNMPMEQAVMADAEDGAFGAGGLGLGYGGGGAKMAKKEAAKDMAPSPIVTAETTAMAPGSGEKQQGQAEQIAVRRNFNPLAVFSPSVRTDSEGQAEVKFTMPDNLTRYRVMAVAVDEKTFGMDTASVTARIELMLRPSAPRFLNYGDSFELPVVVQNLSNEAKTVDIAVRASNAELTGDTGYRAEIPANDRVELRFPAKTMEPGKALFQFALSSEEFSDAAEVVVPVWTPATTEAFAIYGEIDEGAIAQPISSPSGVIEGYGGLEVSTSSTAVSALTDALLYLIDYPFDCSEQIASRLLGVMALRDVLSAFNVEQMPSEDDINASIESGLDHLRQRQNWDGGFAYWTGMSVPYVSIHVGHALARAESKGIVIDSNMRYNMDYYLENIEERIREYESAKGFTYSDSMRSALMAYANYVLALEGREQHLNGLAIYQRFGLKVLSNESLGWLLTAMTPGRDREPEVATAIDEILRHLANRVEETPAAANFIEDYEEGAYLLLHSNRRSDAVVLEGLMHASPDDTLIPKVVRGLLAHRRKGHWLNTQENALILVSLNEYFQRYESVTPDFVAKVWLGEDYAGSQTYKGRTTERQHLLIPMSVVLDGEADKNLVLQKEGEGRLYYRVGMRYAPEDLKLEAFDRGFVVDRVYEAADDPDDVSLDAEGNWHVKLGSRVRVKLTMTARNRRYHVALVDKMPAGFESLNTALATTGRLEHQSALGEDEDSFWWTRYWFEHQNLRDERAEAFTSLLWAGTYTYTYVVKATTPGEFVIPPAKAEEMYNPEVFGRSATGRVIIE